MEDIELFVPGRVGIIGEISDLVAPYLEKNKELIPGHAISVALDKGIYSKAKKSDKFIYKNGSIKFECEVTKQVLEQEANGNTYFSYICGTILYLLKKYNIGGIQLNITKMDLPMKKGLASSAAICITIAKAYSVLYNLNLSDEEIKNISYEGEHLAKSKCGRLDQESILNKNISHIIFEKDKVTSIPITVKKNVYILIVDLNKGKNTKAIMDTFNDALPFPKREEDKAVHQVIGKENAVLVEMVEKGLKEGNINNIGKALNKAQKALDKVAVICSEFEAPTLHMLLNDEYIKEWTYGGKSSGSGGDGTLVLICKDEYYQKKLENYINEKFKMNSLKFCIEKS